MWQKRYNTTPKWSCMQTTYLVRFFPLTVGMSLLKHVPSSIKCLLLRCDLLSFSVLISSEAPIFFSFAFFVDNFVVYKETLLCVPTATFFSPTSTSQSFLLQDSWRSAPSHHITSLTVALQSSPPPLSTLSCPSGGPSTRQDRLSFLRPHCQSRGLCFPGDGGRDDGLLQGQQAGGQGASGGPPVRFGSWGGSPQVRSCWRHRGHLPPQDKIVGQRKRIR